MATVIANETISRHNVDKYNFKVLPFGGNSDDKEIESSIVPKNNEDKRVLERESEVDSSSISKSSKDSLIESLMKKTDEMSSNFIKLQMKMEANEEECKQELKRLEQEAFARGVEAGKEELSRSEEDSLKARIEQFSSSVATLENEAKIFDKALEGIKSELISAALDISKEVIGVELGNSSQEIAKVLSLELVKELQSASKITLKVNPKDHGYISEKLGSMEHVEIVSDSAVSLGGVIAISDAGNIDAQISKRFERVKKAALSQED